jgi:hypothetical protein
LKQRAANFCRMRFSFLASVDVIEFQTTDANSSLDLINEIYKLSTIIIIIIIITL